MKRTYSESKGSDGCDGSGTEGSKVDGAHIASLGPGERLHIGVSHHVAFTLCFHPGLALHVSALNLVGSNPDATVELAC